MTKEEFRIKILAVEDEELARENIKYFLEENDFYGEFADNAETATTLLRNNRFDIAIIDIRLPGKDGLSIVEYIKEKGLDTSTILITGYSSEDSVVKAIKLGVNDFIRKPYEDEELLHSINKILHTRKIEEENVHLRERLERENQYLRDVSKTAANEIIGSSKVFKKILTMADKIAGYDLDTLIFGESGTGKEVIANFIHQQGQRKDGPFIAVNCAAVSPSLFESELFGHERGSFTGADRTRAGLFEAANGGILFLDEITEMPVEMQPKLLRALDTGKVMRIGGRNYIDINVLVIAATNRERNAALSNGHLREDLYHRLAKTELVLPPLRDRDGDIEELYDFLVDRFEKQYSIKAPEKSDYILKKIKEEYWPGNVRQFTNFVRKWTLFGHDERMDEIINWMRGENSAVTKDGKTFRFENLTIAELDDAKKWMVLKILDECEGNKSKAAKHLGLSYPGLLNMLKAFEEK